MNTDQIVAALIAERDRLSAAINLLQGGTPAKRRGRPPKSSMPDWVTNGAATPVAAPAKKKRTRTFSKAQRLAASKRMKARWAAKKKATAKKA
jgi:hypothetical protein